MRISLLFIQLLLTFFFMASSPKALGASVDLNNKFWFLNSNAELENKAQAGDAEAEFTLAKHYLLGDKNSKVVKNPDMGAYWMQKSAIQGNAMAQYYFGMLYLLGIGELQDSAEGLKWLNEATKQGNSDAELMLAMVYRDGGYGITKDPISAASWFKKAASHNNATAEYELYRMYSRGLEGMPKDKSVANKWLAKAVEGGDLNAEYVQALRFQQGEGGEQDSVKAAFLFNKSAEQGFAKAELALGIMNYYGAGIPRNEAQGLAWLQKAAYQNDVEAQRYLQFLNR